MPLVALALLLAVALVPVSAGATECADSCDHRLCSGATRAFAGEIVAIDELAYGFLLTVAVEHAAGTGAPAPGDLVPFGRTPDHGAPALGERILALQVEGPDGSPVDGEWLPLFDGGFDCLNQPVPAEDAVAAAVKPEAECRADEASWLPPCSGCGCTSSPSAGPAWLAGLLLVAALRPSRRRRLLAGP